MVDFDNKGGESRTKPGCPASIDQQQQEASDAAIGKVGTRPQHGRIDRLTVTLS